MSTRRIKLTACLLLIISLLVSVRLVKDILKLRQADERMAAAQQELNEVQNEQLKLQQNLNQVGSEAWQEATIRNTLNMAKPGEVVVIVPEAITQIELLKPQSKSTDIELKVWQKWWQLFTQ